MPNKTRKKTSIAYRAVWMSPKLRELVIQLIGERRLLACACIVLLAGPATGQTIGTMKITASSPIAPKIRYGSTITYRVEGEPTCGSYLSITNYKWKYKYTGPGCTTGWSQISDTGTEPSITYGEGSVGDFTVQADVTVSCGQSAPVVIPVPATVTVLPPDDIELPDPTTGANIRTLPVGSSHTFQFFVKCDGERVGYASGTAKEDLTNIVVDGRRYKPRFMVGDPDLLWVQYNSIMDTKELGIQSGPMAAFNALPTGYLIASLRQKLYLRLPDMCGGTKDYPLKTQFTVTKTKAAADGTYTITITP